MKRGRGGGVKWQGEETAISRVKTASIFNDASSAMVTMADRLARS